jgi:hypothetical protein
VSLAIATGWRDPSRSVRRQHLVQRLCKCGPRVVLECLRHVESGAPVDVILEAFAGLQPADYAAAGADVLPIDRLTVVKGGRK